MMDGMIQVVHQFAIVGRRKDNGYALVTCGLKPQWFVRLSKGALHKNHLPEHKRTVCLQAAIPLTQVVVDLTIKVAILQLLETFNDMPYMLSDTGSRQKIYWLAILLIG
jgi:hypothetical protein